MKLKFYRCFNAVYNRAKHADSELVCVQLLKSFCLPIILYAVEVVMPSKTVLRMLDNLLNRAVYKIFGCSTAYDIRYIRSTVDLPSIDDIVYKRNDKFARSFRASGLSFADHVLHVAMFSQASRILAVLFLFFLVLTPT